MPVYITYHSTAPLYSPSAGGAFPPALPILGAQIGDRETLAVAGAAANGTAQSAPRIARIHATEDACLQIGAGAVAVGTKGEVWAAGTADVRYLQAGERISVIAVA